MCRRSSMEEWRDTGISTGPSPSQCSGAKNVNKHCELELGKFCNSLIDTQNDSDYCKHINFRGVLIFAIFVAASKTIKLVPVKIYPH